MQNVFRRLRMAKGLTQQQLSQSLQVPSETIYSLENGLLNKIAAFYNIRVESLVTGYRFTKDQIELLKLYNSMDDISKGMLLERALSLAEESSK